MAKCNEDYAIQTAIELGKINIGSTQTWSKSSDVISFIKNVYSFLVDEENASSSD